jgi:hypothetical protein
MLPAQPQLRSTPILDRVVDDDSGLLEQVIVGNPRAAEELCRGPASMFIETVNVPLAKLTSRHGG